MQLGDIDIYDPDVYVGGVPHQAYAWLRKNAPVFFHPEPSGPGFWAVLRHADVAAVSKDPLTFSSARSGTQIADPTPEQLPLIRTMMLNLDPPQHGKVRAIVQAGFTPRMVARMAESLRARAAVIVEKAAAEGECEFVGDVAARLPLQVVAELMGVPEKDWQLMAAWGDRLVGFDDPEFDVTAEDALAASTEMAMYAISLAADRRGKKGDDLLTTLVNAKVDGRSLDDAELAGLFVQMTVAGNETTRTLISGGMLALCEHPQLETMLDSY